MAGNRSRELDHSVAWSTVLLGIWLIFSAHLLGFGETGAALWDDALIGAAVVVVSVAAAVKRSFCWAAVALGGWLGAAPFVLGFASSGAAVATDVLTGLGIGVLAATHATRA